MQPGNSSSCSSSTERGLGCSGVAGRSVEVAVEAFDVNGAVEVISSCMHPPSLRSTNAREEIWKAIPLRGSPGWIGKALTVQEGWWKALGSHMGVGLMSSLLSRSEVEGEETGTFLW